MSNGNISNIDFDNNQNNESAEDQDDLQELNDILHSSSRRKDLCVWIYMTIKILFQSTELFLKNRIIYLIVIL